MPFVTDYRPSDFDQIYGNEKTIETLKSVYSRKSDWPHAVLMAGSSGCGKTTIARIIAKKLGCTENGLQEINAANSRGIDTARAITTEIRYKPMGSPVRVYILDEAHQLSPDFQHAILKVLEDAPDHAYFILCTTDPQKVIPTVRNRCMQFEVGTLGEKELQYVLMDVLKRLNIDDFPQDAIREIASAADGCPRQALMILDKVVDMPDAEMMDAIDQMRFGADKNVPDLCKALLDGKKWPEVVKIIKQMDLSPSSLEGVRIGICNYMGAVLMGAKSLTPAAAVAGLTIDYCEKPWFNMGRAGLIKACFGVVVGGK